MERKRVLIIGGYQKGDDIQYFLDEINELVSSDLLEVVAVEHQLLGNINVKTYIGEGKVDEIKNKIVQQNIEMVIVDNTLSGSQIRNLEDAWDVKVIDRNMLILDIFATRAQSQEGKLQVHLAQLKYLAPRLAGIEGSSGRFGSGGVGSRGPGETKLELDRRVIKKQIFELEKDFKKIKQNRHIQNKQRKTSKTKNIAIVGYTNAGKSTLLNAFAKSDAYADNRLFATLDTLSKKVWDDGVSYILTDTVGFVSRLPHELMHAFSATLEESTDADIVLVVFDISDHRWYEKLVVVQNVLKELGVDEKKLIYIANKVDIAPPEYLDGARQLFKDNLIFISATDRVNFEELKTAIKNRLK